jgi:predicted aminopeptidase
VASTLLKILPAMASVLVIIVFSLMFPCCYTLKQGGIMLGYLHSAVPLESLAEKNPDDAKTLAFVADIADIRAFAKELGLKDTKNYTKYVQLDRDYLAAIVSASQKYSFKRYEWKFPIVGSVPYKGFFLADDARKEAAKLKEKNLDVWIRPVDAFSTLGFFRDPLYSYMRSYPINELADLLIHETVHATIFIKGNMNFNEELAEFIGSEGARLYIEKRFGADSETMQNMLARKKDGATFVAYIQTLIAELDALYNADDYKIKTDEEKAAQKAAVIHASQERYTTEYETMFSTDDRRGFATMEINNAYLELFRLYYKKDSELKELYEMSGSDLVKFIAAAKTIGKSGRRGSPEAALREALTRNE